MSSSLPRVGARAHASTSYVSQTNNHDVISALLGARRYDKEWERRHGFYAKPLQQLMRREVAMWAICQKDKPGMEVRAVLRCCVCDAVSDAAAAFFADHARGVQDAPFALWRRAGRVGVSAEAR